MTIKLPQVAAFGFPLSTSPDCRTSSPSEIPLTSGAGFDPLAGGTLTGTYTIASLTGCGQLNDFISMFAAGPDNPWR
jgi:hypothetical protein